MKKADFKILGGLPLVTFYNNKKPFTFLIDTGSNYSILNERLINNFDYYPIEGATGTIYGIDGNPKEVSYVRMHINLLDRSYVVDFQVSTLAAFDKFGEEINLEIAGILGSAFLNRNKFVLDFENQQLYSNETIIPLHSRDTTNNYLQAYDEERLPNAFRLVTPYNVGAGITANDKNFVDPSGGPFLVEGEILKTSNKDYLIDSINWVEGLGCVLILKDYDLSSN